MNKKSLLLSKLSDKGLLINKNNKNYLNFYSFEPFEIDEISIEKKDFEDILILKSKNAIFEYWENQDILIPPWETNWFQLKDQFIFKLKENILIDITKKAIEKSENIFKLSKTLEMSSPTFYHLIKGKIKMITVKKLKIILNYLNIPYKHINDKIEYTKKGSVISIKNPLFPINLNSKYGAILLGQLVSDGCLYIDKKARGVIRTKYSTNEEKSLKIFNESIGKTFGIVHMQKEIVRTCTILRIGSSIIGDSLVKVGAIIGHKASLNLPMPWFISVGNKELKSIYLSATFSDEASIYLEKNRNNGYIILSRYMHLNFTKEQIEKINNIEQFMISRAFPTGHVNKSITVKKAIELLNNDEEIRKILKSKPNLLIGESEILKEFNINHRFWQRNLNITHNRKYSLCCDLFISKKEDLIKFYKEIGFILPDKQEKLRMVIEKGTKTI